MRRGIVLLFTLGLPLLAGCGPDPGSEGAAHRPSDCNEARYFLFDDPEWDFREAVDYPGELNVEGGGPTIDWYAEYERMTPIPGGTRGDSLGLTGHPISVTAFREALPGWQPEERTVHGLQALAGPSPGGTSTIVAIAVDENYTLGVVSYGLAVDDLVGVAEDMDRMCQREWLGSGGRMAECLPTDTACLSSTTTSSSPPTTEAPMSTATTSGP